MISGRRLLITGVTGKAVLPIAAALAQTNEVYGQARFSAAGEREAVAALGIIPCAADFARGDLEHLPKSVDHLLHFSWMRGGANDLEEAMRVNVETTGLLLSRYRQAKSALIVSSSAVYRGQADPLYRYCEGDAVGPGPSVAAATSSVCKIGMEAVARFAAQCFDIPVTIARLNTVMGPHLAYYGKQVSAILQGQEIILPHAHNAHNPIHVLDMLAHIPALLDAAGRVPLTVNWSGDEIIPTQDVLHYMAARTGTPAKVTIKSAPGLAGGTVTDWQKRLSITGPCQKSFDEALSQMLKEMLDGAPCPFPQRDWAYASGAQNRIFKGVEQDQ